MTSHDLGNMILAAFKQAHENGRQDIAEDLLRALETLGRTPRPGSTLGRAYLMMNERQSSEKRQRH